MNSQSIHIFSLDKDLMFSLEDYYGSLGLTVSHDVVTVDVFITEFTDVDCLTVFPFVYRRLTSSFLLPVTIDYMGSMTVRLLSDLDFFRVYTVVFAFWVLRVVNAGHSMRMSARY